jgi:hypothetical protein
MDCLKSGETFPPPSAPTAAGDKTARIWDAATAKEIAVLRGHDDQVLSIDRPRGGIAMVWNRQKLKTAVVACLVALTLATNDFSFARVIEGPVHPILQKIALLLDKVGIDVCSCEGRAPGERPRVELLSDIRPARFSLARFSLGKAFRKELRKELSRGSIGRLFVLPASFADAKAAETQFRFDWNQAPKEARVFISFARPNLPDANKVKEALESNRYTVFMYLNEEGKRPKYTPEFTDEMFSSAGNYLLLDTADAQMSRGIELERIALEKQRPELIGKGVERVESAAERNERERHERAARSAREAVESSGETRPDPGRRGSPGDGGAMERK